MGTFSYTNSVTPDVQHLYFSAVSNNKIYWIASGDLNFNSDLYIYDTTSDSWSQGPSLYYSNDAPLTIGYGNYVYSIGGYNQSQYPYRTTRCMRFNTVSNSWENMASLIYPVDSNFESSIALVNGEIYVFQSVQISRDPSTGDESISYRNSIQIYNILSDAWRISSLSLPINSWTYITSIGVGNDCYLIGGYDERNNEFLSTTRILNTQTNTWTIGSDCPATFRFSKGLIWEYNGGIYVKTSNAIYKYDILSNSWSYVDDMPIGYGTIDTATSYIGSKAYFRSANKSSPLLIYEMASTIVSGLSPNAGFINEREQNTFSWQVTDGLTTINQTSAVVQWQNITSGVGPTNTINVSGNQKYVIIPANTFPNGRIRWRVMATANGLESAWSDWVELTTIDETPLQPTNLNPSSGIQDASVIITFSWRHNSPLSTPQSRFDMQITYTNGTSWIDFASQSTSSQIYNAPANSINPTNITGSVGWRVRTYNSDGVASEWSQPVYFIAEAAPSNPQIISVDTANNFPKITWLSSVQVAYQLQLLSGSDIIFDTNRQYGTDKEYIFSSPIQDGNYTLRLRVGNNRGIWSNWTTYNLIISTTKRFTISLNGESKDDAAFLKWEVTQR